MNRYATTATIREVKPNSGFVKAAAITFKALVLALALVGVSHLAGVGESLIVAPATAEKPSPILLDSKYFPDLFVNQGAEFEEAYIEQF